MSRYSHPTVSNQDVFIYTHHWKSTIVSFSAAQDRKPKHPQLIRQGFKMHNSLPDARPKPLPASILLLQIYMFELTISLHCYTSSQRYLSPHLHKYRMLKLRQSHPSDLHRFHAKSTTHIVWAHLEIMDITLVLYSSLGCNLVVH